MAVKVSTANFEDGGEFYSFYRFVATDLGDDMVKYEVGLTHHPSGWHEFILVALHRQVPAEIRKRNTQRATEFLPPQTATFACSGRQFWSGQIGSILAQLEHRVSNEWD